MAMYNDVYKLDDNFEEVPAPPSSGGNAIKDAIQNDEVKTSTFSDYIIRIPKKIAEITLCGALTVTIDDLAPFKKPSPEQIKNLQEVFCIDVKLFDD